MSTPDNLASNLDSNLDRRLFQAADEMMRAGVPADPDALAAHAVACGSEVPLAVWRDRLANYIRALLADRTASTLQALADEARANVPKYRHAQIQADAYASAGAGLNGFPATAWDEYVRTP